MADPDPRAADAGGGAAAAGDVAANGAWWDRLADEHRAEGERLWGLAPGAETWGIFGIPEAEVRILPDDLHGLDVVELGCGTGYVSAWVTRRGGRPTGIDPSARQLEIARGMQAAHRLAFPLVHGAAERTPFSDDAFDLAISEYGAVLWADPDAWIPEAARILRPGGRLHVLTSSLLAILASGEDPDAPVAERLERPQFGLGRTTWAGAGGVEFHLPHGEWIRRFRDAGFEVLELLEPRIPDGATTRYGWMPHDWARRWPCEVVWKLRLRG